MLSSEQLIKFADGLPQLRLPRPPLTSEQSAALKALLRAIERICRKGEDRDAEQQAGASLIEQLEEAEARREALAPAVDDAMAAQEELAAAGLQLSVQGTGNQQRLVVSRRWMAPHIASEREPAE